MFYQLCADLVLILHLAFILFVLLGGLLLLYRTWLLWIHLPAVLWGIWVEWSGSICPLTPLENFFRRQAQGQGYQEGFVAHYLIPLLYPGSLTPGVQRLMAVAVILINILVYLSVYFRTRRKA